MSDLIDFETGRRIPDQPVKESERKTFRRPESPGGRTVIDVAVDFILVVEEIKYNGFRDQSGTLWPHKERDQVLAGLTPEQQGQAWEAAWAIVDAELAPSEQSPTEV